MFVCWDHNMTFVLILSLYSIYVVHDEVKDKQFELELSWVGDGECMCHLYGLCHIASLIAVSIVTDGKHKVVPQEVFQEAEQYAKVSSVVLYACTWA